MLRAFHDSTVGGHSGFPVTYRRLRKLFAWPKMKQQIWQYVQGCTTCQQAKLERVKYPGLLEPIPLPEGAWEAVTMDLIDGLLQSSKANCILVVVDNSHAMLTFYHFSTHSPRPEWLEHIWTTFTSFMVCRKPSFQTETPFSRANSGVSCLPALELNST